MNNQNVYEGKRSKIAWVLGIIIGIVPLIIRMRDMKLPEVTKDIWDSGGSGIYADFFSANKLLALGLLTLIGVVLFITEYLKAKPYKNTKLELLLYKNKTVYILIGIYIMFAFISTLFAKADERAVAWIGAPGRYEGLFALLFYVTIMILSIHIAQEWWNVKLLYRILMLGAFIMGIIGVGQFIGFDIFQTDGGKAMILPFKYSHLANQVNFAFNSNAAYTVYTTLFHSNYVGSYTAMLMPLSVVAMIYTYLYEKSKEKKVNATIFSLLMVVLWFASHSRGGLVGGGFALILIFILLNRNFIKTRAHMGIFVVLFLVGAVILNIMSRGTISRQLFSLPKEVVKLFSSQGSDTPQLSDIRLEENAVEIDSNLPTFRLERDGDEIVMKDKLGNQIPLAQEGQRFIPQDAAYVGMYIEQVSPDELMVSIANPALQAYYPIGLMHTEEGFRVIGSNKKLLEIEPIEAWGFKGRERVGSARGYIWSRTLPMLKDTWFIGYGPDTYPLHFPQDDVIGKTNAYDTPRIIVDKPHNLYLQIMVSTGVPSLLALMGLFITYFILWIKHIRSTDKDDIRRWMSIGIFVALCGYLVAGLFNDSVVSVAPVFWVLWGLGIGLTSSSTQLQVVGKRKA